MSNGAGPTIPNPDVYLNHFPPDEARQFEMSRNLYLIVLGVVACDILSFIPEDVRIVKRCNGLVTTICFALVRLLALIYMSLLVTLFTTPVPNCAGMRITTGVFCLLTMGTTSFLFLRRLQAIYAGNRLVYWSFTLLWAGTSGTVALLIPWIESGRPPGTKYCTLFEAKSYVPVANFMPAVFDTLVFFAISYKVAFQHNWEPGSGRNWTCAWFSVSTLPVLSKAILKGGQQYYLVTFCLNVFSGAFAFNPMIPQAHRVLVSIPAASLSACLACRAHRNMVEAFYCEDKEAIPVVSGIRFADPRSSVTISQCVAGEKSVTVDPKSWA